MWVCGRDWISFRPVDTVNPTQNHTARPTTSTLTRLPLSFHCAAHRFSDLINDDDEDSDSDKTYKTFRLLTRLIVSRSMNRFSLHTGSCFKSTIKQVWVHLKEGRSLTPSLRTNSTLGNALASLMNLSPCPDGSFWRRGPGVMVAIIRLITSTLDRCGDSATG